jgi:hypothetical protein
MRKYILYLLLTLIIAKNAYSQKPHVWMIGPMLHFNFGDKKMHTSFGIELAYWNYAHFPYSFDGGIEFEKQKTRLYSEAQTGIGIIGLSLGPVMEFRTGDGVKLGIQGSAWANYFLGIDIRFRAVGETSIFSPGLYFKLPLGLGAESDGEYHHHWDWD